MAQRYITVGIKQPKKKNYHMSEATRTKKSEVMKARWQTEFRDIVIKKQKEGNHPWRRFNPYFCNIPKKV